VKCFTILISTIALFYTKWVHTMEIQEPFAPPDEVENKNLLDLIQLLNNIHRLEGDDREQPQDGSLAAAAARTWATFLDDTWVWEGMYSLFSSIICNGQLILL
jgi:hypothetical protein